MGFAKRNLTGRTPTTKTKRRKQGTENATIKERDGECGGLRTGRSGSVTEGGRSGGMTADEWRDADSEAGWQADDCVFHQFNFILYFMLSMLRNLYDFFIVCSLKMFISLSVCRRVQCLSE